MSNLDEFLVDRVDLAVARELARAEFDAAYDALLLDLLGRPPADRSKIIEVELSARLVRHIQGLLP